jgi:hypothetical integral membrane protein (TIGR02206 family)
VGATGDYWAAVGLGAALCAALCVTARRRPGPWTRTAGRVVALVLISDAIAFVVIPIVQGRWTVQSSLPLALCDVALLVAACACWAPSLLLAVELTYFWGLAGTLQAVITPDLTARFPNAEFFEYVVGHVGIVIAALFLTVGLSLRPRRGAAARVFAITLGYSAIVGLFDWATGSNYMFLEKLPPRTSLLSVLGPWPWYILSAAGVAVVLLAVLDAPFRWHRPTGLPR